MSDRGDESGEDADLACEAHLGFDTDEDDLCLAQVSQERSFASHDSSDEERVDDDGEDADGGPGEPGPPGDPEAPGPGGAAGDGAGVPPVPMGGAGGAGGAPGGPPAPPAGVPAVERPDSWEGWFNASSDPTRGRLPKRDMPKHRFKTRNLDAAELPKVTEGSEFAIFRKLWDENIVKLALLHTNARLQKLPKHSFTGP